MQSSGLLALLVRKVAIWWTIPGMTHFHCPAAVGQSRFPSSPTQKAGEREGHVLIFRSFSQPPGVKGPQAPLFYAFITPILLL